MEKWLVFPFIGAVILGADWYLLRKERVGVALRLIKSDVYFSLQLSVMKIAFAELERLKTMWLLSPTEKKEIKHLYEFVENKISNLRAYDDIQEQ